MRAKRRFMLWHIVSLRCDVSNLEAVSVLSMQCSLAQDVSQAERWLRSPAFIFVLWTAVKPLWNCCMLVVLCFRCNDKVYLN